MEVDLRKSFFVMLFCCIIMFTSDSISAASSSSSSSPNQSNTPVGIRAAYWPSYTSLPASSINTSLFTHIYYAFLLPSPLTYQLNVTQEDQQKLPELVNGLRSLKPSVKTILSIGGGGSDPMVFSKLASDSSRRAAFIDSTIRVARKYGFDGVDLDWEFPANAKDMSNLGLLFMQWRKEFEAEANSTRRPRLLLTSAVYYAWNISILDDRGARAYPVQMIRGYVDWVSPMCFDYHGTWENFTGMNSALYDPNSDISTNFGINSWIRAGMPPSQIVMGMPLYGRTWKLQDPAVNGVGAPAVGAGPGDGVLVYSQVVDFNARNGATVKMDRQTMSYYSYAGDSWIGYDDVQSIEAKVQFAKAHKLGGYFFWALGQDKGWTITSAASNAWTK